MIALLDTSVLIAQASGDEAAPDLSGFDALAVSVLSWAELVRGLHLVDDLHVFKARQARYQALRSALGSGLAFDERCIGCLDRILSHVSARGGSARAHTMDRMIAATAMAHEMTLVTRDRSGFAGLDDLMTVTRR